MTTSTQDRSRRTYLALLWMHLTSEPLLALRSALSAYVLYADFGATALQLGICHAIRPVISLFSFYWGANLVNQKGKLLTNLMTGWVLARLPFIFIPFVKNSWYLLLAEALFWAFHRGSMPALMEILKLNMNAKKRSTALSFSFALQFAESIVLGLIFAALLMKNPSAWKGLFCITALMGISSIFFQKRIPLPSFSNSAPLSLKDRITNPWIKTVELLKARPDFFRFQEGFMLGGFGLMLISPAITIYTADILGASHANVLIARNICMGLGVITSIFFWQRLLARLPIARLLGMVILGFAAYPFILLIAQFNFACYYLAFLMYGVAQAGSHLLWHLSGPLFAQESDSSQFTAVNVLMVGVRGLIAPTLGSLLCPLIGPQAVLITGTVILISGCLRMLSLSPEIRKNPN